VAMFADEAWLAARVQHPNVVSTIDVVADAGELFIVMEYIRGESLSALLRMANGFVPPSIAAGIVSQALGGLHAAHEAKDEGGRPLGMIHRDTSPQNILVGTDGLARITDFGIAKAASRLQVTQNKEIKGKLRYMPPEQIVSDDKLDRRADIYATGVVLWEALAGRHLFSGDSVDQIVRSIIHHVPERLSQSRNDVTGALDDVIAKAIARQAPSRFHSAEQFQIALERAVPLASSRAIGEWVQQVAATSLRKKKTAIDLIEHALKAQRGASSDPNFPVGGIDPTADAEATTENGRAPMSPDSTTAVSGMSIFEANLVDDGEATVDAPPAGFEGTASDTGDGPLSITVPRERAVSTSDDTTTRRRPHRNVSSTVALPPQSPVAPFLPPAPSRLLADDSGSTPHQAGAPAAPARGPADDTALTVRALVPRQQRDVVGRAEATRQNTKASPVGPRPADPRLPTQNRPRYRSRGPYFVLATLVGVGGLAAAGWFHTDATRRAPPVHTPSPGTAPGQAPTPSDIGPRANSASSEASSSAAPATSARHGP